MYLKGNIYIYIIRFVTQLISFIQSSVLWPSLSISHNPSFCDPTFQFHSIIRFVTQLINFTVIHFVTQLISVTLSSILGLNSSLSLNHPPQWVLNHDHHSIIHYSESSLHLHSPSSLTVTTSITSTIVRFSVRQNHLTHDSAKPSLLRSFALWDKAFSRLESTFFGIRSTFHLTVLGKTFIT